VVGQIQHMVALVVGQVLLKQVQPRVDLLPQPQLVDHQMDRADAPALYSPGFLRHLIVNIAGLDDWLPLITPSAPGVQATSNSTLAMTQNLKIAGALHAATGNPLASTRIMILTPLPTRVQPRSSPPLLALEKSAFDETFVEPEPPVLFHTATSGSHQRLESTGIDPLEKPTVN